MTIILSNSAEKLTTRFVDPPPRFYNTYFRVLQCTVLPTLHISCAVLQQMSHESLRDDRNVVVHCFVVSLGGVPFLTTDQVGYLLGHWDGGCWNDSII